MFQVSVLGSAAAPRGRWRADRTNTIVAVLSSPQLDLSQVIFDEGETRMTVVVLLGSAHIWVPRDIEVTVDGLSLLGSRAVDVSTDLEPALGRRLRLTIVNILGSVHIESAG